MTTTASPLLSSVRGRLPARPSPRLGQHTEEVLAEVEPQRDGAYTS